MSQTREYLATRERYVALCYVGKSHSAQEESRASADFDAFCANKKVAHVAVDTVSFAFITSRLVMNGINGPRWLGEIGVRIVPGEKSIACMGISDSTKHAHPHAHLPPGRHLCLGTENQIAISVLFGTRRLTRVGLFIVDFLQIYGENSHTCGPTAWPALTPKEIEKWKAEL